MILRNHVLAALAAATCALAPAAFSQEPPTPPPSPQDVGEPPVSRQQDLPPTTTDEDTLAPGATSAPDPSTSADDAAAPGTDPSTPTASSQSATATVPIEDRKIEQFADAYAAVQSIQQKAAVDLQSASNPEQADKVKATAESDMIAAVERTGLQVPEFNRIVERMASDTEIRSRVAAKLQERSGGG